MNTNNQLRFKRGRRLSARTAESRQSSREQQLELERDKREVDSARRWAGAQRRETVSCDEEQSTMLYGVCNDAPRTHHTNKYPAYSKLRVRLTPPDYRLLPTRWSFVLSLSLFPHISLSESRFMPFSFVHSRWSSSLFSDHRNPSESAMEVGS